MPTVVDRERSAIAHRIVSGTRERPQTIFCPGWHESAECIAFAVAPWGRDSSGYAGLEDFKVTARRGFFLIDQWGIVRGRWFGDTSTVFPSEPILEKAREIAGRR